MVFRAIVSLVLILGLAGCEDLPRQGPTTKEILAQSADESFVIVDVDARISRLLDQYGARGFSKDFTAIRVASRINRAQVGDVLAIRLFEASSNGLFRQNANGTTNNTEFPAILVDADGAISLPFVGRIVVNDKSPEEIEAMIADRLAGKAIEPQAKVGILKSASNSVTLAGDVFRSGKYDLSVVDIRLAEAISLAGGSKFPSHETSVSLIRAGKRETVSLDDVYTKPANNIIVQSGDMIVVSRAPKRYTVMGSVRRGGAYPFAGSEVSVLEAIATAGGLADIAADATGVFVFRYEPRWFLGRLGIGNLTRYPNDRRGVPTIYRFNLKDARSNFYAQSFLLEDKDGIYVANAETVQITKLLRLFDIGLSPVERASNLRN